MKKDKKIKTPEKTSYFWEKIQASTFKRWMYFCVLGLCVLPIIIALTGRAWIYLFMGNVAPSNEVNLVLGNYWNFLIQALAIAVGGCLLFAETKKQKKKFLLSSEFFSWVRRRWLSCSLAALLIWSTLSLCFSKDKVLAFWGDDYYHAGLVLLICGILIFKAASRFTGQQMRILAEVLAAVCAFTGLFVHYDGLVFGTNFYYENRYKFMFHNSNHYGLILVIGASLAIGLMLQDKKHSLFGGCIRTTELWLIFNSMAENSARGAFLSVTVILIIWNIYVFQLKKDLRKRIIFLDMLYALTFLELNTGSLLQNTLQNILFNFLNLSSSSDKMKAFDSMGTGRGLLWRYGIEFTMEKPLFGYGLSNLQELYTAKNSLIYSPHNCLILIAASAGIPAVLFYLSGLTGHLIGFFRYMKKMTVLEVTMYAAVGAYLMNSFFNSWVYYTSPYYFMVLGFSYGVYRKYRDQESAGPCK